MSARSEAERPYADAVDLYWAAGWRGILPLPPGRKKSPPSGWTGYHGADPSYPDVCAWAEDRPTANVALRLPADAVAVDVDHYRAGDRDKRGGDTIVEYARRAGVRLPDTWRLTSRGAESPSGRYMFRLSTPGTRLVTAIPDVELLQRHHRYAVAWPSRNGADAGRRVEWIDPAGRVAGRVPTVSELPELPAEWVELLAADGDRAEPLNVASDEYAAWVRALEPGPPCTAVTRRLEAAEAAVRGRSGGSRYDATREHVLAILRLGEMGHHGVREALSRLRHVYVVAVRDRAAPDMAAAEFDRMRRPEAIGLLLATPTAEHRQQCICAQGIARLLDSITDPEIRAYAEEMLGGRRA